MTTINGPEGKQLTAGVRAVLFDVDGTLYRQGPLRMLMAGELALAGARAPQRIRRTVRILATFRCVREQLREDGDAPPRPLDVLQFERTASRLGIDPAEVERIVETWIMERPLKYLRAVRRGGLRDLLVLLARRNLQIGALSDYPTDAKLRALDVAEFFSIGLCTADRSINAFKPHPKGFRHACELWGLAPQEVLYVGDRPETDSLGANAAGIRCVIVGRGGIGGVVGNAGAAFVPAFADLGRTFVAAG